MRRRVAVYGKGGIGKSTISSNLSAALSAKGVKVLQIGCDPKHDSTRLLTGNSSNETVLEYLRDVKPDDRKLSEIVTVGYGDTLCVEAGGPEPGVGCAGRGIISAFSLLDELGVDSLDFDITLYDVLGDVVCGGFAVPIRNEYADTVYVVTSGEFMSIYAANNILRGVANYNPERIGGIIFNSRGDSFEEERVTAFSKAVNIPIIAKVKRSNLFLNAEKECKTVVEMYPGSDIADTFKALAEKVMTGRRYKANFLPEDILERVVLGREQMIQEKCHVPVESPKVGKPPIYASRSVNNQGILHGCAFAGACNVTLSIEGLTTVMHSSRNCAQYAFQLISYSTKRAYRSKKIPTMGFVDPDVVCTSMNESSMIFGGTDELRETIEKCISCGKKNIATVTGCPPGIIGDDTKGVIADLSKKYPDVNLIAVDVDGNLKGDHMQGIIDACIAVTKKLAVKDLPKTDCVNLIGIKPMATNTTENAKTVSDLLEKIGISVRCRFLGDCNVEDIKNMTSAKLSLLITEDQFARMQKAFLQDNYGLEFSNAPIDAGMISTENWLKEIGETFGKEKKTEELMDSLRSEYEQRLMPFKKILAGKKVYVASVHMNVDWLLDLIDDLEMIAVRSVIIEKPDSTHDRTMRIRHKSIELLGESDIENVEKDIISKKPDILASTYTLKVEDENITQYRIPLVPDIGPFGGLNILERWIRASKIPDSVGWKKDVI